VTATAVASTAIPRRTMLDSIAIGAGLLGSTVIVIASVITAIAYSGIKGEAYSPLNHFVSELGELGVSELAPLFNLGLNVGGVGFVVFIAGLAVTRTGTLRVAYGITGVIAGIGGFFVGIFPMNDLGTHGAAALTFFLLGLVTVVLGSVDFWRAGDTRFPRWLAVLGAIDAVAFVAFLWLLAGEAEGLGHPADRVAIWPLTIFEWLLLVGILLWVFLAAATWWRATR
jgi:hypothetical membrane protein